MICAKPAPVHAMAGKKSGGGIAIASGTVVGVSTIALLISAHFGASGPAVAATIGSLVGVGAIGIITGVILLDESTNTVSLSSDAVHARSVQLNLTADELELFDQDFDLINAAVQTVGLNLIHSDVRNPTELINATDDIFAQLSLDHQNLISKIFR